MSLAVAHSTVTLDDQSTVQVDRRGAEIRDHAGRLLIRYRDGQLELEAADGDLALHAPQGRVLIRSGEDITLAAGDSQLRLDGDRTTLATARLEVEARQSRLITGAATVVARQIATTAVRMAHQVEHYELEATRIVEKARDAFREVKDLAQSRVGRLRTLVQDEYSLDARRTTIRSEDDTAIDGKRVLLG